MSEALAGGVFAANAAGSADEHAELRRLVDDIGRRSFEARIGQRSLPEAFDAEAWAALEDTGLSRLTSTPDLEAGPTEAAIVLRGLARHAVAAPIAETDVLAGWLAAAAGLPRSCCADWPATRWPRRSPRPMCWPGGWRRRRDC
ncbi:hypothetical protein H7H74_20095, partial [Mycolicibacterium chitae]|nr:hypothetical protein [Mycolicibacterium chitae]